MLLFVTRLDSSKLLVGMARYLLEIFPAFLLLAAWGLKTRVNRLMLYLSVLGLLFLQPNSQSGAG